MQGGTSHHGAPQLSSLSDAHVESLDKAFLFLLGFTTFSFAALQVVLGTAASATDGARRALVLFVPFFFTGLIYPFYIGHIRGAVDSSYWKSSMLLRVRGWVYLVAGASTYAAMVVTSVLGDSSEFAGVAFYAYFVVVFLGVVLSHRIIRFAMRVTGTSRPTDLVLTRAAVGSAIFLALSAYSSEELLRRWLFSEYRPPWIQQVDLFARLAWPAAFFLLLFVLIERGSTALSTPEMDLTWQACISTLSHEREERSKFRGFIWFGRISCEVLSDSLIFLYVESFSRASALCLAALSIVAYLALHWLYLVHSAVGWTLALLAVILVVIAIRLYSEVPVEGIRDTYPRTKAELRSVWRRMLDC